MITVIGDVHGKTKEYLELVKQHKWSIQIGDMGFSYEHMQIANDNPDSSSKVRHRFFGGNHDNYDLYDNALGNLGDCGPRKLNGVEYFFVRGSVSIDCLYRVQQYMNKELKSWWYEEELSHEELSYALELYQKTKPSIVLSHDCPIIAKKRLSEKRRLFDLRKFGFAASDFNCRTQVYLQKMFEAHQPDLWVFGHYHRSEDFKIDNTRFICLNELEAMVIN